MASRIRLTDLAKQAGVSTATVSRVLNDKGLVAPDTRRAVLAALDILGYERPERLRKREGGLVGLIVPELVNPIFPSFAQHLQVALAGYGYAPLLGSQVAGATTEDTYVNAMLGQQISGIIFVSGLHADETANVSHYQRLLHRNIPFVTINGPHPQVEAPDFSCDDQFAVDLAVRHLVAQGHRRIGLATGQLRFGPSHAKSEAFNAAMQRLVPQERPLQAHTLFTLEGGQAAAQQLIAAGCTAIICGSDIMALGAIRYCHNAGLQVPRDVSIIGYDGTPLIAFTNPPLTTFHQPVKAMCDAAVSTLMAMINGDTTTVEHLRFTPELVVRESTGVARDAREIREAR